jgi:hypothetical protein
MFTKRKIVAALLILLALLALAIGTIVAIFIAAFSSESGFGVPQDCLLIQRTFEGQVRDSDRNPISGATVKISSIAGKGFESGAFTLSLKTDNEGQFTGTEDVFACDMVIVSIAANNYESKELLYDADHEYSKSSILEITTTLTKER